MLKIFKDKPLTIEDYFVDKEQLKRYKNGLLEHNEVVHLSNKKPGALSIDISNFKDVMISIENSIITDLKIFGYNINFTTSISINNCDIFNGFIALGKHTNVSFEKSLLIKMYVTAECINFNEIHSRDIGNGKGHTKIFAGNESTKKINFSNTKNYYDCPIELHANSRILSISNCNEIYLNGKNINILNLNNTRLYSNNVIIGNSSNIVNSNIQYCTQKIIDTETLGYFASKEINFSGSCRVSDCIVETNYIDVDKNSKLSTESAYIHSMTGIALRDNSEIISHDENSEAIDTQVVYFYPNAHFNANNIDQINNTNIADRINPNYLKDKRKQLVKTLNAVVDKYNKQINKY